jgi:radical SAM-linked protein
MRLIYRKDDVLMYIGHQDLLRFMFRMLRRAEMPFATSGKFSPKPRVSFGPALPLGVTAAREPVDIELAEGTHWDAPEIESAAEKLAEASAPRDFVVAFDALTPEIPTLSKQIAQARYEVEFAGTASQLEMLPSALDGPLTIEHRGKSRDLKPAILRYTLQGSVLALDALAGSAQNLNIVQLARLLSSSSGAKCVAMHRVCLLTDAGERI